MGDTSIPVCKLKIDVRNVGIGLPLNSSGQTRKQNVFELYLIKYIKYKISLFLVSMDVKRYVKLSHFTPSAVPLLLAMSQFSTF